MQIGFPAAIEEKQHATQHHDEPEERGKGQQFLIVGQKNLPDAAFRAEVFSNAMRGKLSPPLLLFGTIVGPFGFVFHYGELDFLLHVVNAVNDHAHFVADGVSFL